MTCVPTLLERFRERTFETIYPREAIALRRASQISYLPAYLDNEA